MKVLITRLDKELPIPSYAKPGDAGADLYSRVDTELKPGERKLIPTGIAIAIPPGYAAFVHPRSGRAIKEGLGMVNAPGTVDADYRGEVKVILVNLGEEDFHIRRGDRIAQLVIAPVIQAAWAETDSLDDTARGAGGFGSTGAQ